MEKFTRRYGLSTAVCMVVGTVIGSGIFFKAQNVLVATGGNMPLGIAAWCITGVLMIVCSLQFAIMATKHERVSGVVDYAEATCGKTYAYYLAWFMVNVYYPGMASVLAWVSARYFGVMFGWDMTGPNVILFAGFFLVLSYAINALSPKIAGKIQVSATVIKLIPIFLMAVVGTVAGIVNGVLTENFKTVVIDTAESGGLFSAVVATAFAYEGWIVATSINAELKNPKRNLPLALVIGSFIVVVAYVSYYVGIAGGASVDVLITDGATTAFRNIFGTLGGTFLNICIVISCLGTLNGLMVGATRGMYAIADRDEGPKPELFVQIDKSTNMVTNSAIWGLFVSAVWLLYFYGANLVGDGGWFGVFNFDSSELPIITIYAFYIPMFIMWIKKEKDLGIFKRFILPSLSVLACLFMIFAAIYAHGITPYKAAAAAGKFSFPVLFYIIVFAVIMIIGFFCSSDFKKLIKKEKDKTE